MLYHQAWWTQLLSCSEEERPLSGNSHSRLEQDHENDIVFLSGNQEYAAGDTPFYRCPYEEGAPGERQYYFLVKNLSSVLTFSFYAGKTVKGRIPERSVQMEELRGCETSMTHSFAEPPVLCLGTLRPTCHSSSFLSDLLPLLLTTARLFNLLGTKPHILARRLHWPLWEEQTSKKFSCVSFFYRDSSPA